MTRRLLFLAFLLGLVSLGPPERGNGATPPASTGEAVTMSGAQWETVLGQFEGSVFSLAKWLEKTKHDQKKIGDEIKVLEDKVAALRKETRENSNVISEIRLKGLLNDLKEKLEENSTLQHEWEAKQKDFEQKAYSLLSLYNDRIEMKLESSESGPGTTGLDSQLADLTAYVQKRNQIQNLLKLYGKGGEGEKILSIVSLESIPSHDKESRQLTLDLLRDHKKELEEQLEKWSLEQEEIKNELKLQGKMQELLDDIHQINEDSNFSRGGLKSNDLDAITGKGQRAKLEARLGELQTKITRGEKILSQIDQLMAKVQKQINSSNEGGDEK